MTKEYNNPEYKEEGSLKEQRVGGTQQQEVIGVNINEMPVAEEEPSFGKKVKNVFSDIKHALVGDSDKKT